MNIKKEKYNKQNINPQGEEPLKNQVLINFINDTEVEIKIDNTLYKLNYLKFISKAGNEQIGLHLPKGKRIGFITPNKKFGILTLKGIQYTVKKFNDNYYYTSDKPKLPTDLTNMSYHEDNIKAEISHKLKIVGVNHLLEYTHTNCRFDIAILKNKKLVAIIEVKKKAQKYSTLNYSNRKLTKDNIGEFYISKQVTKYINTGYPVFVCRGYENINKALDFALQEYNKA